VCRYAEFEKLNALWNGYISEILAHAGPEPTTVVCGPILLKADYHGAFLTIEDCRCKSRIGLSGICVKETKNMFEIVTANNALLNIPKEKTLFRVKAVFGGEGGDGKHLEWRLWGDQFLVRSGERAGKKFGGKNIRGKALLEL
jgi:ribonuclease P protein subunit POP4